MRSIILLFVLFCNSSALKAQLCNYYVRFSNQPYFSDAEINIQKDIIYGNAIDYLGANVALTLDVYYPILAIDTLALRPLILLVHGGGLISGDKINYSRVCKEFAKRGFVAVSVNYRLGLNCLVDSISEEKAKYRAQQDVHAAFRFVASNTNALRIDTSWMFIGGGSAGSVAAMGLVYISQNEWNAYTPSLQSSLGTLSASGNSLTTSFSIKAIYNDWGATLKSAIEDHELLPMVSFHGDADATVAVDSSFGGGCVHVEKAYGSRALHNYLSSRNTCSDLSVRPGGGHGVYQDTIFGVPYRVGRASCFFRSLFCANCATSYQTDSVAANCSLVTKVESTETVLDQIFIVNPFSDYLQISETSSAQFYNLTDYSGSSVFSGTNLSGIDFTDLRKGLYILHITTLRGVKKFKLLKM